MEFEFQINDLVPIFVYNSFYFIQCEAKEQTSKGPQTKTTEPMVSIKVTNCRIQLGWILVGDGFAKNYMESRPEAKKSEFFI